jgi:citrate lyase beta subunit
MTDCATRIRFRHRLPAGWVFTASAAEVAAARDLVDRFEAAGGVVCLDARGRMVDLAVVRDARRTLAQAVLPAGRSCEEDR